MYSTPDSMSAPKHKLQHHVGSKHAGDDEWVNMGAEASALDPEHDVESEDEEDSSGVGSG